MEKLTVHRGLAELKLLDSKISKKTKQWYCKTKKASADKIDGVAVSEVKESIKANYQSISDLIKRRASIKSGIVKSNAVTLVEVGGNTKTIAEWVEYKTSIIYEKNLYQELKKQYNQSIALINKINEEVSEQATRHIEILYSDKNSIDQNKIKDLKQDYIDNNKLDFVDPIKIKEEIDGLEEYIEEFETEIDFKLSESNATTFIEI